MSEKIEPTWQVYRDPAAPNWPGLLVVGPTTRDGFIKVQAGEPANFADSNRLAERVAAALGGFTRKDVTVLRDAGAAIDGEWAQGRGDDPMCLMLNNVAARIEALLPPEKP